MTKAKRKQLDYILSLEGADSLVTLDHLIELMNMDCVLLVPRIMDRAGMQMAQMQPGR